jgi:SEC-C motif-containing protein
MRKLARPAALAQAQFKKGSPCPCRSGLPYTTCCQPYHAQQANPPTPAELFRARFSAYALNLSDFIIHTTHPDSPHWEPDLKDWRDQVSQFHRAMRFLGCEVLGAPLITLGPDGAPLSATMTYRARLGAGAKDGSFTERGEFKMFEGRWCYDTGEQLPNGAP